MKLNYPRYSKGERWWNTEDPGYAIDTDDYIKEYNCIEDCETILELLTNETISQTIDEINENDSNKILSYFTQQKNLMIERHKLITREMSKEAKGIYDERFLALKLEYNRIAKINNKFVFDNKDEFMKLLNNIIYKEANKLKLSRSEANRRYYLKKKEILSKAPKKILTEEEKKERQKQYCKKYYETHKKVNESEKTEAQIKRKETNKQYYQSKKELQQQISELLKSQN